MTAATARLEELIRETREQAQRLYCTVPTEEQDPCGHCNTVKSAVEAKLRTLVREVLEEAGKAFYEEHSCSFACYVCWAHRRLQNHIRALLPEEESGAS